jgi:nucleotide-binding universal stress UspA family protein
MQCFKKLLVVITAEMKAPHVLRWAISFARRHGAELDVIEVVEETPPYAGRLARGEKVRNSGKACKQTSVKRLETLMAPLKPSGLQVNLHTTTGSPVLEIINMVRKYRHDLVVKTVEPERKWQQLLWGCADTHLLRHCPSALWLVQPTDWVLHRRILVAVDPDIEDPGKCALGIRLLRLGAALAHVESAQLLVGHAWHPFAEAKLKDHLSTVEFGRYLRGCQQAGATQLQTLLAMAQVHIPPDRIRLVKGHVDVVIPRLVKRLAIDLVIMGTVSRSGFRGLVIGNTAERMLSRLTCSILTLKLPGWVASVKPSCQEKGSDGHDS